VHLVTCRQQGASRNSKGSLALAPLPASPWAGAATGSTWSTQQGRRCRAELSQNQRIIKYLDLGGTHGDHQVQNGSQQPTGQRESVTETSAEQQVPSITRNSPITWLDPSPHALGRGMLREHTAIICLQSRFSRSFCLMHEEQS